MSALTERPGRKVHPIIVVDTRQGTYTRYEFYPAIRRHAYPAIDFGAGLTPDNIEWLRITPVAQALIELQGAQCDEAT